MSRLDDGVNHPIVRKDPVHDIGSIRFKRDPKKESHTEGAESREEKTHEE